MGCAVSAMLHPQSDKIPLLFKCGGRLLHFSVRNRLSEKQIPLIPIRTARILVFMRKGFAYLAVALIVLLQASLPHIWAQQRQSRSTDEAAYGSKFFDQLHALFGRFQDSDLQQAFRDAQAIQCSELIGRTGEWRPVAFFNEDRSLGAWYRTNIREVKSDLQVYTFQGNCAGKGSIDVTSEFPTVSSYEQYSDFRIDLEQVDVMVNDPVKVEMNSKTKAYTFELPYLFLTGNGAKKVYSLAPPDRNTAYAPDMMSRWECKAVSSTDLTYRFLICRVNTAPRQALRRNETWMPTFGASAFFILSDGTEAKSSVNMTFGDTTQEKPEATPAPKPGERPQF
jgi:hypothetical protein